MRRTAALLVPRRVLIVAMSLFAALLVGCGSRQADKAAVEGESTVVSAMVAPDADGAAAPAGEMLRAMPPASGVGAAGAPTIEPAAALGRMLIRNVSLTLVVADVESTGARVERLIASRGGFVSSSNMEDRGGFAYRNYTLRVPTDRLDATLIDLRQLAVKIANESQNVQDVTEQAVDLQARLRTLRATEEELIGLLKDARARGQKAEDVMAIYRELTGIRTQIEQYQGQLQSLQNMTALSTVSLQLTPDAATGPIQAHGWRPGETVRNSVRQLVGALRGLGDFAIWAVIVLLPTALLAGAVLMILLKTVKRIARRGRKVERE